MPVIREIKSYVYSVTPQIHWSGAKCGVLEGKQIACPATRLCLFLLLSMESRQQMWALKTNVQLKTVFSMIYFFYGGLQEYFVLSSGSLPACCRDMSECQDRSHSQTTLFPAAIFWTLGGHFTFSDAFFPLPLFQTYNAVTLEVNFISVCFNLVSPAHHTHIHHTVSVKQKQKLPSSHPTQIRTVDSQVLGQSSWQELTSVLPYDRCHKWKTRQTRFPHKGVNSEHRRRDTKEKKENRQTERQADSQTRVLRGVLQASIQ